jgi:hypothetical protein
VANPARPLDSFPFVRTRKIEEARNALARVYAEPVLIPERGVKALNVSMNRYAFRHMALGYTSFGAAVRLKYPPANSFVQLLPIRGSGEFVIGNDVNPLAAGRGATISPGRGYCARYSERYQYIILQIDAQALTNKLATIIRAAINEPLRMEPAQDFSSPAAEFFRRYLLFQVEQLNANGTPQRELMQSIEQVLMTLFLFGNRHNYSDLLERSVPDAAPSQVRRAEEYIEENPGRPIALEDIASEVSASSLFRSFEKRRGYSPVEFVARLRSKRGKRH